MILEIIKDAILANIGPLKDAPKSWKKRCCMLCHSRGYGIDTRSRFGIQFNPTSIACNCFNCGFSASYTEGESLSKSFVYFLKHLHIDDRFIKQIEFEIFKEQNKITTIREGETESSENRLRSLFHKWKEIDLPADSLPITKWLEYGLDDPNFLKVVNYSLGRKIFDLDKFYWTPNREHNLNQRLIIPYYFKGKIVGYTSRLCFNSIDKSIPKYYQQSPTDFVYNLDNQENYSRKFVIVTEGVLDAWSVDGISILGEIGQSKIDIINRLQKSIIVCPDRDKKGYDLVDIAMKNNWAVSLPKWGNNIKDAAEATVKYGRLLTTYSIISSAITDNLEIKLKWDIESNERKRKRNY